MSKAIIFVFILVSLRAPDPVQILTDPGWFSRSRTSMEHQKCLNQNEGFIKLFKIFIQ